MMIISFLFISVVLDFPCASRRVSRMRSTFYMLDYIQLFFEAGICCPVVYHLFFNFCGNGTRFIVESL